MQSTNNYNPDEREEITSTLTDADIQKSLMEAYLMDQMREATRLMSIVRDASSSELKKSMAKKKLSKVQKQLFRAVR